jgi:Rad3-related DNA helicase
VVRKGRENYLCLLNLQDMVQAAQLGNGDLIGLALTSRWALHTRDGDMTGGDFPAGCPACSPRPRAIRRAPETSSTDAGNASTRPVPTTGPVSSRRPSAPAAAPTSSSPTMRWS